VEGLLEREAMNAVVFCRPSSYGYFTTTPWRDRAYFPGIDKDVTIPFAGYVRGCPDDSFAGVSGFDMPEIKRRGCWIRDLRPIKDLGPHREHAATIVELLKEKGVDSGRVGLERATLPHGLIAALEDLAPGIDWVESVDVLLKLQEFKSEEELERLRKACEINEKGMMRVLESLRVGVTPQDLNDIYQASVAGIYNDRYGHFHPITFGTHHLEGEPFAERELQPETLVHIDQVVVHKGLISDLGRNFYFGNKVPPEVEKLNGACNLTVDVASKALRPGIPCAEIERLARESFFDMVSDSRDFSVGILFHGAGWILYSYPFISPEPQGEILPGHVLPWRSSSTTPALAISSVKTCTPCTTMGRRSSTAWNGSCS